MTQLLVITAAYLLGSIPFGYCIVKLWKGVDIRTVGSGNIGATNVGRVLGAKGVAIVLTLDALKGLLPPFLCVRMGISGSGWQVGAGLAAIMGHNYSLFLKFKGGKGVATSLGALIGIAPFVAFAALGVFLVEFFTLRYVSLGALAAGFSLPFFMHHFYPHDTARLLFALAAALLGFYRHRTNIARLKAGTEPKVSLPWNRATAASGKG